MTSLRYQQAEETARQQQAELKRLELEVAHHTKQMAREAEWLLVHRERDGFVSDLAWAPLEVARSRRSEAQARLDRYACEIINKDGADDVAQN
jgi:hypothetical protein